MGQPTSSESQTDLAKEYATQSGGGESQDALAREYNSQGGAGGSFASDWAHRESPISNQWMSDHPIAGSMLKSFDIGNVAKNAWEGGKGVVKGTYDIGKDLANNPNWVSGPDSTYEKFVNAPSREMNAKAQEAKAQGRTGEAIGYSMAAALPFVGPWAAQRGEQVGRGDLGGAIANAEGTAMGGELQGKAISKVAQIPGDISALNDVRKYAGTDPFRTGLQMAAHDMLNKAADGAKQKLWNSHNLVSNRVGGLKADIANADLEAGAPRIAIGDLIPQIDELSQRYKAAGGALPKFDAAVAKIPDRGPYVTFDEAAGLRSEIGSLGAKAIDGTRDAGAIGELEQMLKNKLSDRANELNMSKQFEDYNGLWRTLKGYEENGPLGRLLNAQDGQMFFDTLRDPKNGAALRRTSDSLSDFGLDKNYLSDLAKDHATLHNFAKNSGSGMSMMGRFRALSQHPVAGGLGWMLGKSALGWPGGLLGTIGGANIADAINVSKDISSKGGPPDTTGEMKQFDSKPSGKPMNRAAQPNITMQNELIEALKSQGFKSKEATASALRAIQKNPKGTFGDLFSDAIRRQ